MKGIFLRELGVLLVTESNSGLVNLVNDDWSLVKHLRDSGFDEFQIEVVESYEEVAIIFASDDDVVYTDDVWCESVGGYKGSVKKGILIETNIEMYLYNVTDNVWYAEDLGHQLLDGVLLNGYVSGTFCFIDAPDWIDVENVEPSKIVRTDYDGSYSEVRANEFVKMKNVTMEVNSIKFGLGVMKYNHTVGVFEYWVSNYRVGTSLSNLFLEKGMKSYVKSDEVFFVGRIIQDYNNHYHYSVKGTGYQKASDLDLAIDENIGRNSRTAGFRKRMIMKGYTPSRLSLSSCGSVFTKGTCSFCKKWTYLSNILCVEYGQKFENGTYENLFIVCEPCLLEIHKSHHINDFNRTLNRYTQCYQPDRQEEDGVIEQNDG